MKILVLGAGVVGITTAYALLADGHDVIVVDRGDEAANFTSFANAGLMAPGHAYAWASPKAPGIMLRSLWRDDQAIRFRPRMDPALWRWTFKFLRQCTATRAVINTQRKARLSVYAQALFKDVVAETGVVFDGLADGLLFLYRSTESYDGAGAKSQLLRDEGIEIDILDRDGVIAKEPALAANADALAGGLFTPTDESGDARLFTIALARVCAERGADIRFATNVTTLSTDGDRVTGAMTDKGRIEGDAVVMALGCMSPALVRDLGVDLPVYPIKGYSVTLPTTGRNGVPRMGGVDEDNLLAYCPMGDRLRVTATAEFAGFDTSHTPADFRVMLGKARELFPDGADYSQPTYWAGLRPMTPEGTPILGRAKHRNLWFNTGHGHMGWTMACGTARITADLIAGRDAAIDLAGLTLV